MVACRKICKRGILGFSVVVAAFWLIGNLLYKVELDGRRGNRDESLVRGGRADTLREAFESLPAEGVAESGVIVLDDNPDAWAARWRLLNEARNTLDVSYFILDADIYGISFLGHLLHKAQQGVRVRILLDAIGTALSRQIEGNDYLDALVASPNVTIKMYRPYWSRFRDAFLKLNPLVFVPSDHDKILLADGRRALIGGRNIAREYLSDPRDYGRSFHDCDALLTGYGTGAMLKGVFDEGFNSSQAHHVKREAIDIKNSAMDLLLAYEAMNAWAGGRPVAKKTVSAIRERNLTWIEDLSKLPGLRGVLERRTGHPVSAEVRLIDSSPRLMKSDDAVTKSIRFLAETARNEIFIQVPYLILSPSALTVLEHAASRGVRITILTNSPVSTDNPMSQALFLEQWPRVMSRVPTLRLFVAADSHNIHAKLAVIDNELVLVGTYNLDPLSMSFNGELVAAVWSDSFARRVLVKPMKLIGQGAPGVREYRIARDEQGRPERDKKGNIQVSFGPEDHSSPEQWKTVQIYRTMVRLADKAGLDLLGQDK
jgi:putative cardiolipin synthase